MALCTIRVCLARGGFREAVAGPLCLQKATITSKAFRTKDPSKPAPWPYKEKNLNRLQAWYDRATKRFDENTKLIVVEGGIATGKTAFAKTLAQELDMLHVPAANMDLRFINAYGYDLRKVDEKLEPDNPMRSFDEKNFLQNPKDKRCIGFQVFMYQLKHRLMLDCLAHMLNTGQGVVMERSPFSDYVFVEAMAKAGYISRKGREYYYEVKANTIDDLLRPHLVIYLDCPVSNIVEKIKKRNLPHEVNSPALTTEYLTSLETNYKYTYLKEASIHSELLVYDWSEEGDMEVVVEDVERINFDKYDAYAYKYDTMLEDWRNMKEYEWSLLRYKFTNIGARNALDYYYLIPKWDVPEIVVEAHHFLEWKKAWREAPGNKFIRGFNKDMGDGSYWFKNRKSAKWLLHDRA